MKLAEKEHKKYNKKVVKVTNTIKEERLPEWFDKKIEKKEAQIEEKNAIEELLKEYQ